MQFSLKLCTFEVQLMMKIAEYARTMMEGYVTTFFFFFHFRWATCWQAIISQKQQATILGTIHILRQQKKWVGGFKKW